MQNLDGLFNTLVFWDSCGINGIYYINTMYIYYVTRSNDLKKTGRVSQIDHGSVHFGDVYGVDWAGLQPLEIHTDCKGPIYI